MKAQDASDLWPRFVAECAKLDQVRGENFWNLFTEYQDLKPK
jgi:hypothetical protein